MAVKEGLMALLQSGPAHGYRLKAEFDSATGGAWQLNIGQVYTTLDRLVRDGMVEADDEGDRKNYHLTEDGHAALGQWWGTGAAAESQPRDELMIKVLIAVSTDPERALDVIGHQRDRLLMLLQHRQREARDTRGDSLSAQLVADAMAVRAEADLRWLDLCEERLLAARAARGQEGRP